jgi:hypothetical protein
MKYFSVVIKNIISKKCFLSNYKTVIIVIFTFPTLSLKIVIRIVRVLDKLASTYYALLSWGQTALYLL